MDISNNRYNSKHFNEETIKLLDSLANLNYTKELKNYLKGINIATNEFDYSRGNTVVFSTICKDIHIPLFQIKSEYYKNPIIIFVYSLVNMLDLLALINKLKEELDKYFIETNQRILEERINTEEFKTKAKAEFLSKFLNK